MTWQEVWTAIKSWVLTTGIKVVIAIAILIFSFILINIIARRISKRIDKKIAKNKLDKTLSKTILHISKFALKLLIVLSLIAYLGINISAIVAVIASAGIGIGMAFNGALSNFSGGILILMTRPFKVDDFIMALDIEGTVEEIRICHTKLRTPNNKTVYLPNGTLSTSTIINYTEKGMRRLDLVFPIAYSQDFDKARSVIETVCAAYPSVLKDPALKVVMEGLSSSSVEIKAMPWVKASDFINSKYDLTELIKKAFNENGVEIPFNQLDVHVKNDSELKLENSSEKK